MAPLRLYGRWFVAATIALSAALVLLHVTVMRSAYERSVGRINTVTDDAVPAVLHLGAIRHALQQIRVEAALLDDLPLPDRAVSARERWVVVDAHLAAFDALPDLPGELPLHEQLTGALRRSRRMEERALETRDAAACRRIVEREVLPATGQALDVLDELVAMTARAAGSAVDEMVLAHSRAGTLSLGLLVAEVAALGAAGAVTWTGLLRAEGEVRRRLEEMDAFAGRIAHDLQGPLQTAMFSTAILEKEVASDRARGALERVDRSLTGMSALVDTLLAFARAGGRPRAGATASVGDVAREVALALAPLEEQERARLTLHVAPELLVAADVAVLRAVLENLLRNALLYLGSSDRREVELAARSEQQHVLIEVRDSGPGIPPDLLRRLFQPFERGSDRPGGTGLGLATVRRLVEAHGGQVTVTSQVGSGATFHVRLPAAT